MLEEDDVRKAFQDVLYIGSFINHCVPIFFCLHVLVLQRIGRCRSRLMFACSLLILDYSRDMLTLFMPTVHNAVPVQVSR